jgi:hypothetical protein
VSKVKSSEEDIIDQFLRESEADDSGAEILLADVTEEPHAAAAVLITPELVDNIRIPPGIREYLFDDDEVKFYKTNTGRALAVVFSGIGTQMIYLGKNESDHDLRYYFGQTKSYHPKLTTLRTYSEELEIVILRDSVPIYQALRIIKNEESIFYNLGDKYHHRYAQINKDGIKISDDVFIHFESYGVNSAQVNPVRGGSLDLIDKYVNLTDDDLFMFKIYLLVAFIPDIQHPVLLLTGEESSGKTTLAGCLTKLIDPSPSTTLSVPQERKSLYLNFRQHYVVAYDNLSKISRSLSDEFCKIVTGTSIEIRKLFTDSVVEQMSMMRIVVITALSIEHMSSDFIDRCLPITMNTIRDNKGMRTREREKEFDKEKPLILGAIFYVISKVLRIIDDVPMQRKPRFDDFQKWGYACAEALDRAQVKDS